MFTYLLITLFSVSIPAALSRSERFGFGSRWKQAWSAVVLSAIPFILWDMLFTHLNIWSFNSRYLLGVQVFNLPVEEVLFFLTIPFACLFIYQQFNINPLIRLSPKTTSLIWGVLALTFLLTALLHLNKMYTMSVGILGFVISGLLAWIRPKYSGALILAMIIQYIPFFLVNGLLTYLPVVKYSSDAIIGLRIGTIPIEDFIYSFAMLVGPVAIYELLGNRRR